MTHTVHIAYGFHVNLYHSFRGDAPDNTGFGSDIRIIRRIIELLNELNERGIPVKGTWDIENAFSLEDLLPKHAPDIIEGLRARVQNWGDEQIIMGYANGALGAMTPQELDASIQLAITNEYGSGLRDLFGAYAPIVRPQEVMFSPSQVKDYRRNGIEALCLYYSAVPFDAFRTIIPQLPDEIAFNPVTYTWEGESITVLPTYNNGDIVDAGSLRSLAKSLHAKQQSGAIGHDVMIFINMDADAAFWEPFNLPGPLKKIPNTQGILGLAQEVADLDFVVFDTPGGYLKTHPPLAGITFGHDTADGSYSGYSSWAEKPFNRLIWSRIEQARMLARNQESGNRDQGLVRNQESGNRDQDSPGFRERLLLLSTTHFGLASPVLNIDRERRALALSEEMLKKEQAAREIPEQLTLLNSNGGDILSAELSFAPGWLPSIEQLGITSEAMQTFGGVALSRHDDGSVASAFVLCKFARERARYAITAANDALPCPLSPDPCSLTAGDLAMKVCKHGEVLSVKYKGRPIGGKDFVRGFLTYANRNYPVTAKTSKPLPVAGQAQGLRVEGELHLPGEEKPGLCQYDFFTLPGFGGILARVNIQYPYTPETYAFSTQSSALGRFYDVRWQQAAPFQLTPRLEGSLHVVKRNFSCAVSDFPIKSFRDSVPENESMASFNHQLTGGFVGLSNGETGLLLANARQISGSMAHCPMRLKHNNGQDQVHLNPFGTYAGPQRVYPSRGNGSVREAFVVVAPQSRSLAPAYNGAEETAVMALFGYGGLRPGGEVLAQACAFADGANLLEPKDSPVHGYARDHVRFQAPREAKDAPAKLNSVLFSGALPGPLKIAGVALRAAGQILKGMK